jgi:uncharacterized membrane protein
MLDQLYLFLAKFGFTEPLHSPVTHMPIGLVVGALIFFIVAIVFKNKNLVLTARHASILAFVFVFPTILLGVFDWIHFYHATLFTPIKIKMALASVVLILLGAGIILGSEIKLHTISMTIIYSATCVCMIGLGYFGAGIIYGRGLEMKTQRAAVAGQAVKKTGAPAPVADSGGMKQKAGMEIDTAHKVRK